MKQPLPPHKLASQPALGHSAPDYFKPLPPTPSTHSVPSTPNPRSPSQYRLKRTASDSSWKPPADWTNSTKPSDRRPPAWPFHGARSYSLLIPEPSHSTNVWMESVAPRAVSDPVQKTFLNVPDERPLPAVPEVPRRNPSRLSLREHTSQKNSPRITESPNSSSNSDVSLIDGLSKITSELSPEQYRLNPTFQPLSPLRTLRVLPKDEEKTVPTDILDGQFKHEDSAIDRPKTGDPELVPQPLSWRKVLSGNFNPESLCTCSCSPPSLASGQRESRGKLRTWISRDSSGYSKQPEKSQDHQTLSNTSTRSSQHNSPPGTGNNLTHIVQCGKNFWFHIKQTGSTSTEQKMIPSSCCPVHPNESLEAPACSVKQANVLFRLPGGFALVRQSAPSTSTSKATSVCENPPKSYHPQNDPYMRTEIPPLDLPPMRSSWATHESEVTATSTRAIHNCSRISLGSIRSPDSGSNTHLSSPSPLAQELLLPCDLPAPHQQPLRSSSLSLAPTTNPKQRVDSIIGKIPSEQMSIPSTKSAWKFWKNR